MIPRSLAISDLRRLAGSYRDWLEQLSERRVDALQLREKHLDDRAVVALARQALSSRPLLFVNGRADLALAAGATGVHLPVTSLPAAALRQRFGARLRLAASTHCLDEIEAARRAGVDFAVFGPVFPPLSKSVERPIPGLEGLRRATRVGLPILALGGITADRVAEVAAAGAHGVAGISTFQDSRELPKLMAEVRRCWG